nr:AraC family transcriptional regulator [Arthrobacter polaris]UIK88245.1 helix-turn-helix transcriptional regulator [Arthrobacter polaris]
MTAEELATLTLLRRAKDMIDRDYALPLDVATIAAKVFMSPAHFSRKFRAAYGETPYNYLMTRRIERASALLRAGMSVTDACMAVGATSLGSFSTRFTHIMKETPTSYKARDHGAIEAMPPCFVRSTTRPRRTATAPGTTGAPSNASSQSSRIEEVSAPEAQ